MLKIISKSRRPLKVQLDSGKVINLFQHGDSAEVPDADRKTESISVLLKQKRIKCTNVAAAAVVAPPNDDNDKDMPDPGPELANEPADQPRHENNRDRKKNRGGNNRG